MPDNWPFVPSRTDGEGRKDQKLPSAQRVAVFGKIRAQSGRLNDNDFDMFLWPGRAGFRVENRKVDIGMEFEMSGGHGPGKWTPLAHARPGLAGVKLHRRPFGPGLRMVSSATEPFGAEDWLGRGSGIALGSSGGSR